MSLETDSIEFTDYVKRNLCSYSEKIWSNYVTWWRNLWPSLLSWRSRCPRWRGRCTWRSPTCPGPSHSWTWGTSRCRCGWSADSWRERLEWECYRGGESGGPVPRTARITDDDDLIFLTLKTSWYSLKISDRKSSNYSIDCLVLVWSWGWSPLLQRDRQTDPLTGICCTLTHDSTQSVALHWLSLSVEIKVLFRSTTVLTRISSQHLHHVAREWCKTNILKYIQLSLNKLSTNASPILFYLHN